MDAQNVISLIENHNKNHPLNGLIDCRFLMEKLQVRHINHIYREANTASDSLAQLGCCLIKSFELKYFDSFFLEVENCISFDFGGVGPTSDCNNA